MCAERPLHRFNVAEYEAMVRHGILRCADRVELREGAIVEMPALDAPARGAIIFLTSALCERLAAGTALVAVRQALTLFADTVTEPDLLLLRPRADGYRRQPLTARDTLLAIEIAHGASRVRRAGIQRLYASASIPEYWLVDLDANGVDVCRMPQDDGYAFVRAAHATGIVAPERFPDCRMGVGEILGLR